MAENSEEILADDELLKEQTSLTFEELDYLQRLFYVSAKVEDRKKEKFSVNVVRNGNFIFFVAENLKRSIKIAFTYDTANQRFVDLQGADIDWVKDFLKKYRVLED